MFRWGLFHFLDQLRAARHLLREESQMDTKRTFGVELELADVRSAPCGADVPAMLATSLNSSGIDTILAPDGSDDEPVGGSWKVVHDPTAGPDGRGGAEIVSPPMSGHDGLEQIRRVCRALDRMGATVNEHCGLHVHHDARDRTVSQMMRLSASYRLHQESIIGLLPISRHNNRYAMPETAPVHDAETLKTVPQSNHMPFDRLRVSRALSGGSRHRAVNWLSYARHGTVEFRQHHGTVDAGEITYWVLFTQAMVSAAIENDGRRQMEVPGRWLRRTTGDGSSCRETLMWAELRGHISDDPHYWGMRRHYRETRVPAA